ncbi:MAG: hypothetical protein KDA70_15470 [Planctomycetaceae bacterium]|nr:hypothetical protein [Planctomycetaceae bacterium]
MHTPQTSIRQTGQAVLSHSCRISYVGLRHVATLWTKTALYLATAVSILASVPSVVPAAEFDSQNPWVSHTFADGHFQIQTPAGWQLADIPNIGRGNIYVVDPQNDLHLIAYSTPKIDVHLKSMKEVVQLVVQSHSARFEQAEQVKSVMSLDDASPAADVQLKAVNDNTNLVYTIRVLDCDDYWVELHLWTIPSQFTKNEKLFDQIRESLQLANNKTLLPAENQVQHLPDNPAPAPGTYEVVICIGILLFFVAMVISAIQRIRKRLSSEANPTWKTYANELGGYIIVLILILIGGIAVLLDDSEPQAPPVPVQRNNSF